MMIDSIARFLRPLIEVRIKRCNRRARAVRTLEREMGCLPRLSGTVTHRFFGAGAVCWALKEG